MDKQQLKPFEIQLKARNYNSDDNPDFEFHQVFLARDEEHARERAYNLLVFYPNNTVLREFFSSEVFLEVTELFEESDYAVKNNLMYEDMVNEKLLFLQKWFQEQFHDLDSLREFCEKHASYKEDYSVTVNSMYVDALFDAYTLADNPFVENNN